MARESCCHYVDVYVFEQFRFLELINIAEDKFLRHFWKFLPHELYNVKIQYAG
jgi:hypothetical protein